MRRLVQRVVKPELILLGAFAAIAAVMISPDWYHNVVDHNLFSLPGWLHAKHVNLHFISNEVLMCFFFLIAAKEVRESLLPGGALHGLRRSALPLLATTGGVAGPALVFYMLTKLSAPELTSGWVVPTATDIAFAYLAARLIFKEGHPAIAFLLTLAVVDDGVGLALIPSVYSGGVQWGWFALVLAGMIGGTYLLRGFGFKKWYWYLGLVGFPGWLGFLWLEVEPAMALVPLVVMMPHAYNDLGFWSVRELTRHDALSEMEHAIKPCIGVILLVFGFANAGIDLGSFGEPTWIVLAALIVGKLMGITLFTFIGIKLGLSLPEGMKKMDVPVMAAIAGIGFTVALFVAGVAFSGTIGDQAKLGAFLSLPVGAALAFGLNFVRKRTVTATKPYAGHEPEEVRETSLSSV